MTGSARRAVRLELRLTSPTASLGDLEVAVGLAEQHDLVGITVSPWLVKPAKRLLGRSRVRIGTVVGFPHGGQLLSVKAFEASKALEHGANQVDFVLNGGALASGDEETVLNDMLAVVDMAHSALAEASVIMEVDPIGDDLLRTACHLAERAGADAVVTSTGAAPARVTVGRTRFLREHVGPRIGVKAAGRLRTPGQVWQAHAAGASRVAVPPVESLVRHALEVAAPAAAAS